MKGMLLPPILTGYGGWTNVIGQLPLWDGHVKGLLWDL